ncbi:MAG: hypothetical protein IJ886_02080 [Prevotella sp.]|nr:hypothetical protein [Prevotella sp.]MBR3109846.1 hypothetical protein [Prevotella sp.]MBR3111482.1 hypothetical protein [Prevotella sp.]
MRRAIIAAVDASKTQGAVALHNLLQNSEYQKFLIKKQGLKKKSAKEAWEKKSDAEKLLAFAQEVKDNLPAFIFACREFDETETAKGGMFRHRRLADCHLNGLFMLDIDHIENPVEVWYKMRDDKELMKSIALVHITSSEHGVRIVGVADLTVGNLADNQIALAQKLGYKADESCIDATRNSFAPKEEDIIYINEELLFDYYNEAFDKRFTPEYRQKKTQPIRLQFSTGDVPAGVCHSQGAAVATQDIQQGAGDVSEVDAQRMEGVKWHGYDIQSIIDARYADKLPCADDSNRHKESLKLATDLLLMLDGDTKLVQRIIEVQPWVQEIIEERDENVAQTVESAAGCVAEKEKKYASSLPSKAMQEAVKKVAGKDYREVVKEISQQGQSPMCENGITKMLDQWGAEIEELFGVFPLLKEVCSGLKRSQYPAAVFVAGGTMMTLMTRCWYRFYHRPQQERRLNCSLYIIGHPASNKSMADDIYKILSAPIAAADKAGKAALNRYKQDTKKKAANKEGKDKPQALIRIHPARTSNGQLIQDMLNAKDIVEGKEIQLHMLTFDTELDNSITLQSGGSWINKQSMELKAFHNEEDGQMYQNSDSPVDEFNVTWNFIYTGTPIALKKKVNEKNFGSGLSTRLAVIPMPKTNFEMMAMEDVQTIDWQRIERMKTWAYKLDTRFGELPFWPLVKRIYDWVKNRMEDCAEDNSEANELMLKRVPYHALNYAAPFIDMRHFDHLHLEGKYWEGTYEVDELDWKLCELIARIQYATQQHFFGVMAEKYFDDMNNDVQISGKRHQQKSINGYNRLPDVFTKEDVIKCFGYNSQNAACMKLARLEKETIIEKITKGKDAGKFRKVVKLLV